MNISAPSSRFIHLPGMKRPAPGKPRQFRIPGIGFMPNKIRNHFIATAGEFVGTFMFLFFAFSATQVANAAASSNGASASQGPNTSNLLYISLAFGFSLAVNAWVFFRISGGLFNPAVTLAMALIGAVTWIRAACALVAQLLGAMAAAAVVSALFPGKMVVSTNLAGGTSVARGVFIEMFLTAELVFTILMLAAEKHKATFIAPIGIGLALFVAELSGVYFTGGSLNPARSFGPCVVLRSFPGYHWIYWVGPALGSMIAVGFYGFVKALEYETANPGQDFNENEDANFEFDEEKATAENVARPSSKSPQPNNRQSSRDNRTSRDSRRSKGRASPRESYSREGRARGGSSQRNANGHRDGDGVATPSRFPAESMGQYNGQWEHGGYESGSNMESQRDQSGQYASRSHRKGRSAEVQRPASYGGHYRVQGLQQ